jgi:hypothetical protein
VIHFNANAEGASGVKVEPTIRPTTARITTGPYGSSLIEISFAGGLFAFEHDSPERRAAIKRNFGCEAEEGGDEQ